jgi:hypothetical protein
VAAWPAWPALRRDDVCRGVLRACPPACHPHPRPPAPALLQFLVIWRFFRFWALADGIVPPENMTRCVANNYDVEGFWKNWHASYNLWLVRWAAWGALGALPSWGAAGWGAAGLGRCGLGRCRAGMLFGLD